MNWFNKIIYQGKAVKILSLIAVFLTSLFLTFVFYSETEKINDFSLPSSRQEREKNVPTIRMLFLGDLMLDRHVGEKIEKNGLAYLLENLAKEKFFDNYNLISGNLEGAVTNNGTHYNPIVSYDFAFSPAIMAELKKYNFSFFNLANNHFTDQGERGIIETRKNLDNLNFHYVGCQDGQLDICSEKIIAIKGKKIGVAGFSMVYGKLDNEKMTGIIKNLADVADIVIVNIHWGKEYEHQFNKIQQKIAYNLITAGADIIIGHHPHVVQGIEIYQGKPIFYSLGNFIFDQYFSSDTQEGLAVGVTIIDKKTEFSLYPLKAKLSRVELMKKEIKEKFFNNLTAWSEVKEDCKQQIKQGKLIIDY